MIITKVEEEIISDTNKHVIDEDKTYLAEIIIEHI
jgi:hypothetical protein